MNFNQKKEKMSGDDAGWRLESRELLQDWLILVASDNARDISGVKDNMGQGMLGQGSMAEFVFLAAEGLQLNDQSKFMAIELCDRFVSRHLREKRHKLYDCARSERDKLLMWADFCGDLESRMELFVVACCQIASKYTSVYGAIPMPQVQKVLTMCGLHFSTKDLRQCEQCVLTTLQFKVSFTTCYDVVNILLDILGVNHPALRECLSKYRKLSIKLLTVLYLKKDDVYTDLLKRCQLYCTANGLALKEAQEDKILTSTAVIAAAACIDDPHNNSMVLDCLHSMVHLPVNDIDRLKMCLLTKLWECGAL